MTSSHTDTITSPTHSGAAPPAGSGVHNYHITVTALDVTEIGLDTHAGAAYLGFVVGRRTLARATLILPTPADH